MKSFRVSGVALFLSFGLQAQVGTVQNAAVYQSGVPNIYPNFGAPVNGLPPTQLIAGFFGFVSLISPNVISPRMLAVLSYPSAQVASNPYSALPPAPAVSAALSIRPSGSAAAIPVTVTSAVQGAITFVVPAGVPLGGAELLYKIDDQPTQWASVNVVQSSFAFFRAGLGAPAIAQAIAANGSVSNIGLTTPAQPGQTLLLTGSGLGYGSTVSATIGGIAAPVTYAGPHPTEAGHDRILVQIPMSAPDGCYVPVNFTYNQTSLTTTISKTADGSPCQHPWQLSLNDMKTLDAGGSLADGVISLASQLNGASSDAASRNESANMSLSAIDAAGVAGWFTPAASSVGCTAVSPSLAGIAVLRNGDFSGLVPPLPDIGSSVNLLGPDGALSLPGNGSGGYYLWNSPAPVDGPPGNPPAPAIAGGKWTWQSSGGKDLPVSSFNFTLPAPIQLNGGAPLILKRAQDQTIAWNGAAFDAAATISLYLSGGNAAPVTCSAPARAGIVTIPAALLSGGAHDSIGSLVVTLNQPGSLSPHATLQLQNGATLLMLVSYSTSDSRPVIFQ